MNTPIVTDEQLARLQKKIRVDPITGCWNWIGVKSLGYGQARVDKRLYRVHRLTYARFIEPPPPSEGVNRPVLHHMCNNRSCCNPDHLSIVSDTENILMGDGATAVKARKTHCNNGHLLPEPINGHRRCMICHRAWNRENYAKSPDKFLTKVRERRARLRNSIKVGICPTDDRPELFNQPR